jgi:hypothetical protein
MKTVKYIYFGLLLSIINISCEEDVTRDISLETVERLVIEGGIERNENNLDAPQVIKLTKTSNFLYNNPTSFVADAVVSVSDGNTTWSFNYTGDGNYTNTEMTPQINKTYTLTIVWNDQTYKGSDYLQKVASFDNFYFEFEKETLFTDEGYFLKFDSTDPINVENYYYYRVFKNGSYVIVADPGNSETLIVSDKFFDGQLRTGINPNEEVPFLIGDTGKAQQLGISKKYYYYLYQLFKQTGNQGFSAIGNPPPASIRSNVINLTIPSNRALGFFFAADVEEESITITK